MQSFSRVLVWLFATLVVLQLVNGGWSRLRAWLSVKFIGVPAPKVAHG